MKLVPHVFVVLMFLEVFAERGAVADVFHACLVADGFVSLAREQQEGVAEAVCFFLDQLTGIYKANDAIGIKKGYCLHVLQKASLELGI